MIVLLLTLILTVSPAHGQSKCPSYGNVKAFFKEGIKL